MSLTAFLRLLAGVIGALAFALLVGFLEVRAEAVELGVRVDWLNAPTRVGPAGSPWLQRLAVAAVGGLTFWILWNARKGRATAARLESAAVAVTLILISGWFLLTTQQTYPGAIESALANPRSLTPTIAEPAPIAWLRTAGLSPTLHVMAAVAAVLASASAGLRTSPHAAGHPDPAPLAPDE